MKLESQVTSREPSQRLKELGVKQESQFWWYSVKGDREKDCYVRGEDDGDYGYKLCSAFTVAELGVILSSMNILDTRWHRNDISVSVAQTHQIGEAETEADARAGLVIRLIEQKHITVEEVNARLEAV